MAGSPPRSRARRLLQRLGCAGLSFLIALLVGLPILEWILRANVGHFLGVPGQSMFMYEMDGERSYRLVPGWRGEQTVDGRTTSIRVNSRSMRGPEVPAKAPGERRVVMFGDSYVFGHGVAEDETIAARLQARLDATGGGAARVLNCGVSGQGLRDLARNMERQRDLDADLIIACTYLGNDFTDDCRVYTAIIDGFLLTGPMARLAHESMRFRLTLRYRTLTVLERLLADYAPSWGFDRTRLQLSPEEVAAEEHFPPVAQRLGCLYFDRRAEDALVDKVLRRCREHYGAMQRIAGDTPVLHVWIPGRWHVFDAEWRRDLEAMGLDPAAHEPGRGRRRLAALAAELGLEVCDLTEALRAVPDNRDLWFRTDRHLSPRGCSVVAEELAPRVERLLRR